MSSEAEIRALFDAHDAALREKDLDALAECFDPEVRTFDIGTQTEGFAALRQLWEGCFPYFENPIEVHRRDLRLAVTGEMAVASCYTRLTGMNSDHPAAKTWLRATVCLQKSDGRWRIVHDHASLPVDCGAEKPTYILDET